MTQYVIRSKLTGEFFRAQFMGRVHWTDHVLLAAKYDAMSLAAIASAQVGIPSSTVEIEQIERATMHRPAPMQTLDAPRKITTAVRKLSPETLAECKRVGGAAAQDDVVVVLPEGLTINEAGPATTEDASK